MSVTLRVRYPARGRAIHLRTDADWGKDVPPVGELEDGSGVRFEIPADRPVIEFKPVLREADGTLRWAQGGNFVLAAALPATHVVYPTFFEAEGRISEPYEAPEACGCASRRIRAYYPPGYDENPFRRYPVVYMHDGTNLFFPDESFQGQTWNVKGTIDALDGMNSIEPVIVVGVQAVDREGEYTAAGYAAYGRYLAEVLKPLADARCRTLPGPESTVVMGSSLGGLVSLFVAWQWPHVFGGAGCLSSTFGIDDDLFRRVAREPKRRIRIYLDSGHPRDNFEATLAMRDLLLRRGYRWGDDLLHFAHPGAGHHESAWARRLHLPLQFFFGRGPAYG